MHEKCSERQRKAGRAVFERAGYKGPDIDRKRKAQTSRDMLGQAGHKL